MPWSVAGLWPISMQLDLLFPSCPVLEDRLGQLETSYLEGTCNLSEFFETAEQHAKEGRTIIALSSLDSGDVWCVDNRAVLTLSVCKWTYEMLGLVGSKLPFKEYADHHAIRIPLNDRAESRNTRARVVEALKAWDARRQRAGNGPWQVSCHLASSDGSPGRACLQETVRVTSTLSRFEDVLAPHITLPPRPTDKEKVEDWNDDVAAIFEWVGMACLGAQRLSANDSVNPFVAVYESPAPSHVGSLTHMRWRGFLSPSFIRTVMETTRWSLENDPPDATFVSITAHAHATAPVTHLSPGSDVDPPSRVPRHDGEDTLCMVMMPKSSDGSLDDGRWIMAKCVGRWDKRWG